jgi:hypothetical protein
MSGTSSQTQWTWPQRHGRRHRHAGGRLRVRRRAVFRSPTSGHRRTLAASRGCMRCHVTARTGIWTSAIARQ